MKSIKDTNLKWKKYSGKVRDVYDIDGSKMIIISTDRISAFDVVFDEVIPGKGILLNQLSKFWFSFTKDIVKNHLIDGESFPNNLPSNLHRRSMYVNKAERIKVRPLIVK